MGWAYIFRCDRKVDEAMTLAQFIEKFQHEIKNLDVMRTEVKVLSTYWTQVYGGPVDAEVTNIGLDENNRCLYIEIDKDVMERLMKS